MKYPRYPKYKDSGIEWIGKIPASWIISRLGNFIKAKSGFSPPKEEIGGAIPIYGANGVIGFTNTPVFFEQKLLVGRVGSSGAVNIADPPCWVSDNALIIDFENSSFYFHFLYYLLSVLDYSVEKSITAQPLITSSDIKSKKVSIPPLEEQLDISLFLESETSMVDSLISKHEKIIKLLNEKRQVIITHTVTKGLDPNVPMKDSGIEWIGDIPEHWKILKLRRISTINPQKSEVRSYSPETSVSFLPMESIGEDGQIELYSIKPLAEVQNGYTYFRSGDVIVAKITPCFENGKGAIAEHLESGIGFGTTELIVIRPSSCLYKKFLYFLTVSYIFRKTGQGAMYGSAGQKRLPAEFIANFAIGIPNFAEQVSISKFIENQISKINYLISMQQKMIELLKEKRQVIITLAVTGKIDVRGLVKEVREPGR